MIARIATWVLLLAGAVASPAQVVINEIMYNPAGPEAHTEFIELVNAGDSAEDLARWSISDGAGLDELVTAPGTSSLVLPAGGYAVILDSGYWSDGEAWYDDDLPDEILLLTVGDAALGSGGLSNSQGETVQLIDNFDVVQSSRSYQPGAGQGISEERITVDGSEEDGNWAFSAPGGSPGRTNTVTPPAHDLALTAVSADSSLHGQAYTVTLTVGLANLGRDSTLLRNLELIDPAAGADSVRITRPIAPLPPGWQGTETVTVDPVSAGLHRWRLRLLPPDDRPSNDTLALELSLPYPDDALRLSELMPVPEDPPSSAEWIELVNLSRHPVNVAGWSLQDAAGTTAELPADAGILAPDSVIVVAQDSTVQDWPQLRDDQILVPETWPALNNAADIVRLISPGGQTVDSVRYEDPPPGRSLFRPPGSDAWQATVDAVGATPGRPNTDNQPGRDVTVRDFITFSEDDPLRAGVRATVRNDGDQPANVNYLLRGLRADTAATIERAGSLAIPARDSTMLEESLDPAAEPPGWVSWTLSLLPDGLYHEVLGYLPHPGQPWAVSELMAAPSSDSDVEWLELVNTSPWPVSPAGLRVADETGEMWVNEAERPRRVAPDEIILLAEDPEALAFRVDTTVVWIAQVQGWVRLNNDGDRLVIVDPTGFPTDTLAFGQASTGESLRRVTYGSGADPSAWVSSGGPGTPGLPDWPEDQPPWETAVDDTPTPSRTGYLTVTPNPFSPDGDGYEDTVQFLFDLPSPQVTVTLRLFDSAGRPMGTLLRNHPLPGHSEWTWDGRSGLRTNRALPLGLYVYVADIQGDQGERWRVKGTLASAGGR